MTELFERHIRVELDALEDDSSGFEIRDLRIDFKVKKTRSSSPNTGKIQIYNPNESVISKMKAESAVVRLFAGYSKPAPLLFEGTPVADGTEIKHKGPDQVLKIEAEDGGREFKSTRISKAFAGGTKAERAIESVIGEFDGLSKGSIDLGDSSLKLEQALNLSGKATDVMDRLASNLDVDWSVQNRSIRVVPKGGDSGVEAAEISNENGNLLEVKEKKQGLEVVALLLPKMLPGDRFKLTSRERDAIFRSRDIESKGSNYKSKFQTKISCREA